MEVSAGNPDIAMEDDMEDLYDDAPVATSKDNLSSEGNPGNGEPPSEPRVNADGATNLPGVAKEIRDEAALNAEITGFGNGKAHLAKPPGQTLSRAENAQNQDQGNVSIGTSLGTRAESSVSQGKDEGRKDPVEPPEWEVDSSPYESSSDDSSDSSSSGSDDEYELLDPAEQARRLMEDDGNSDGEGASKGPKGGHIRSHNEQAEDVVDKPDITVTPEMAIEELGAVENRMENLILIKAKVSGEYRVLEARSVLCLADRTVVGFVWETLGRVQEPLYCVKFQTAEAIEEAGISKGTKIFYVPQHSTFVFTKALQAVKGSDASNIHDEEVAADEIEFSDDEAEAEYKRNLKAQKQARRHSKNAPVTGPSGNSGHPMAEMNYDEGPQEDHYTPLSRPANLHEMMGPHNNTPHAPSQAEHRSYRGRGDRGQHRGRGSRGKMRERPPNRSEGLYAHPPAPRPGNFGPPAAQLPPNPWQGTHVNGHGANISPFPVPFGPPQSSAGYPNLHPPYGVGTPAQAPYPSSPSSQHLQWPGPYGGPPYAGYPAPSVASAAPDSPQFPAGAAVNPWFFQSQHQPPNGPPQ